MKKATLFFTILLVYGASSMLFAQQVSVNYNQNANFSQYHTHTWGSDDKNKIQNSILAQVPQQDIEAAMQQKGLQKVQEVFGDAEEAEERADASPKSAATTLGSSFEGES